MTAPALGNHRHPHRFDDVAFQAMTPYSTLTGANAAVAALAGSYALAARLRPGRPALQRIAFIDTLESTAAAELLHRPQTPWRRMPRPLDLTRWIAWYEHLAATRLYGALDSHPQISFNLHSQHLVCDAIFRSLRQLPSPERLIVEWVETSAAQGTFRRAVERLHQLRDRGFGIALDDAGAGQDALLRLRNIRPHWVKLDGALLQAAAARPGSADDLTCRALTGLARDLNAETVAEWVETPAQLDYARAIGCTLVQGWLLGAPRQLSSPDPRHTGANR